MPKVSEKKGVRNTKVREVSVRLSELERYKKAFKELKSLEDSGKIVKENELVVNAPLYFEMSKNYEAMKASTQHNLEAKKKSLKEISTLEAEVSFWRALTFFNASVGLIVIGLSLL